MSVIQKGKLLDHIMKKVGVRTRSSPGSPYLSRTEMLHLNSWIDAVMSIVEFKPKEEQKGEVSNEQ